MTGSDWSSDREREAGKSWELVASKGGGNAGGERRVEVAIYEVLLLLLLQYSVMPACLLLLAGRV